MPEIQDYDLEFRPKTYWIYATPEQKIQATVKGEVRRVFAHFYKEKFSGFPSETFHFKESLTQEERRMWGAIHPRFLGGEFLPDLQDGESEIARVSMESVTRDVISIRARWEDGKIRYSVVDEYEPDYDFNPKSSDVPLTLKELIDLIDTAGPEGAPLHNLVLGPLEGNYHAEDAESLRGFISVSSAFYPSLRAWYQEVCEEWIIEKVSEEERVSCQKK